MNIDWSEAPAHATHWCPGNVRIGEGWIYKAGGEYYRCYAERGLEHIPAFPDWRKERLIQRPPKQPWAGEGNPPVGTIFQTKLESEFQWSGPVEMLWHGEKSLVVKRWDDTEFQYHFKNRLFRPVRTAEQIAAEERETAIEEMTEKSLYGHYAFTKAQAKIACTVLYDAGYRK